MDGINRELGRRHDAAKLLGYLNFSDGKPDPRFQRGLADAYGFLLESGDLRPWVTLPAWLIQASQELETAGSAAFRDTTQARAVVETALVQLPAAYRAHHVDLLAHQSDPALFNAFFLVRACEAVLRVGPPWDQQPRLIRESLAILNDYVGYRPIAILETRPNTDYYPHEKVRPIPLYLKDVGVAPGPYADLLRPALELISKTEPVLLEEACFDPDRLQELAFDPRAHDHFHPVNKRPNVLFGEWDPHTIDGRGFYRRFVLRQMTIDTLLGWVAGPGNAPGSPSERLFEAAAVLAGTILMGAGVSGTGPNYYDSTVTLSRLVPKIARYRDGFYQRLLNTLPGPHGERMRAQAEQRQQPFAGVRQFLNSAIASQRASHLQDRRLAQLFAAMGYPRAARKRAIAIAAPAVRFSTEVRIRQTEAGFAADRGRAAEAGKLLAEVEILIRRGIDCGALIDPWNILGYQGLFPIFPGREDTVRDPRSEELINTIGRQLELYARAISAAAVAGDAQTRDHLAGAMRDLAAWWDRYATSTVAELPRIAGSERADAAEHVAKALAAWARRERDPQPRSSGAEEKGHRAGSADLVFWRQHREGFTSPAAFAHVIEALVENAASAPGTPSESPWAALALLMTWLSESDTIPLEDPSASFDHLAEKWLRGVIATKDLTMPQRASLIARFFELLEANADDRWHAPDFQLHVDDRPGREEDDDKDEYSSAYEGVTFRDSADDGEEGAVAGGEPSLAPVDFPLEAEADHLEGRLKFLLAVARLWRIAARPDLWGRNGTTNEVISGWLATTRRNHTLLVKFLDRVKDVEVPEPLGGHEGMIEFDRRRALKGNLLDLVVATCVETGRAARALAAVLVQGAELPASAAVGQSKKPNRTWDPEAASAEEAPAWESILIRMERAIGRGDTGHLRSLLPGFVSLFRHEPLLYCPPSDGGKPRDVLRAQTALHILEDLLTRLARLGLLRETFHLTRLARQMEWNSTPEGRRVSSFDQLFRTALVGVVETLLLAAADWRDDAGPDGPLSTMLFQVAEAFQDLWIEHSKSLRLSVLESVADDSEWEAVLEFVSAYGSDLFTVPFLGMSNMRGILARGVAEWLDHEVEHGDTTHRPSLVTDWEAGEIDRARTAKAFEVVLQALIEHYDEYRDYNTTTTQSDYGENIHILLDFLRIKVRYDRYAWRIRPLALAHEVLCKRGQDLLAARWRAFISDKTKRVANELLDELGKRESKYGVRLRTVRDRLEERFLLPLVIDQAAAQVPPAAEAARLGANEDNPAFARLLAAVEPLGATVSGVGLEVPAWVRRLEEALRDARSHPPADPALTDPIRRLDLDDLRRQLSEWDKPLGE